MATISMSVLPSFFLLVQDHIFVAHCGHDPAIPQRPPGIEVRVPLVNHGVDGVLLRGPGWLVRSLVTVRSFPVKLLNELPFTTISTFTLASAFKLAALPRARNANALSCVEYILFEFLVRYLMITGTCFACRKKYI